MTGNLADETLYINYRHLCFIYFDDCMIGNYNRCPTMKVVLGKWPALPCSGDNKADPFDYNPAHACWYVLNKMAGLPATDDCVSDEDTGWLDCDSFESGAQTLKNEGLGISILFDSSQKVLSWLDAILAHVRGQIKYGADGKLHFDLIRDDFEIYDLPVVDESIMLEPPTIQRKGWIETVNETKVQYARRVYLLEDEKEEECLEETITLSKDACSDKMHLETTVHGTEGSDLLVAPITGHVDTIEFDRVYFKGGDAAISAYTSAANRDDDFDQIALGGSLPYSPEAGDIIVVRTTLTAPEPCEMEAVYHAAGDCPPFTFQKKTGETTWVNLKKVYQTFVGPCKLGKCENGVVRVTNNVGQESNELTLDKQCDCTGVEVSTSNDFYECGACGSVVVTGLTDNECCHQTVNVSDQGGTADYIKKGSMIQYTVCAPEAPCEGTLVTVNANCCGSDIGTIEMGCEEKDLIVSATGSPFTPGVDTEAAVTVTGSKGKVTWSLEGDGTGFSLAESETAETTLYISGDACGSKAIVAVDECDNTGRTVVYSTDGYWRTLDDGDDCTCLCTGLTEYVNGAGWSVIECKSDDTFVKIEELTTNATTTSGSGCYESGPCLTWNCTPFTYGCGNTHPPCILDLRSCPTPYTTQSNWAECCYNWAGTEDCPDDNETYYSEWGGACRELYRVQKVWECGP
jgi:hypothetical protein